MALNSGLERFAFVRDLAFSSTASANDCNAKRSCSSSAAIVEDEPGGTHRRDENRFCHLESIASIDNDMDRGVRRLDVVKGEVSVKPTWSKERSLAHLLKAL